MVNSESDEELSPSLENLIVLTWLRLIDKNLPNLVKQRYGTELRSRTLASLKPEMSQALDSLQMNFIHPKNRKFYVLHLGHPAVNLIETVKQMYPNHNTSPNEHRFVHYVSNQVVEIFHTF